MTAASIFAANAAMAVSVTLPRSHRWSLKRNNFPAEKDLVIIQRTCRAVERQAPAMPLG